MRLDRISVALRQRSAWEAMDLGSALVRRHAGAIWRPWFLLSLPFLLATNALAWGLDRIWLAPLLMWWLKPLFDRIPLYVLSRAVFGEAPDARQTLNARELWSWRSLLPWLSIRRLHPARALLLPVDMLEGLRGARRSARCAVLQRAVSAQAFGLILACLGFEFVVLVSSFWLLALLFLPLEFLGPAVQHIWTTFITDPPLWAHLLVNLGLWLATSLIEPFYVGAGFGLYLNRRTQLEAWDVELGFRRLAERARELMPSASALALVLALMWTAVPVSSHAQEPAAAVETPAVASPDKKAKKPEAPRLNARQFVGDPLWKTPDPRFAPAVQKAMRDPLLAPKKQISQWVLKNPPKPKEYKERKQAPWIELVSMIIGAISEYGLWLLAGIALAWLLWRLPKWLPWVRERMQPAPELSAVVETAAAKPAPALPTDVRASARGLWQQGQRREALALLYRASVERIAEALGTPFPPGATEADCLRRSRRLPEAGMQQQFARVVRAWQAAAYAWRYPDSEEFEALLQGWQDNFGVRA
jgi:hypothetical protein